MPRADELIGMRIVTLFLCVTLMFSGCASTVRNGEWPSTVVTIEDVRMKKPMRLVVGYKIRKGVPLGTTVLRLYLTEQGRIHDVGVMESSGHANLDEAAINAAWDASFHPYMKDGKPMAVTLIMPMHLR